jgi:hypothetical protein
MFAARGGVTRRCLFYDGHARSSREGRLPETTDAILRWIKRLAAKAAGGPAALPRRPTFDLAQSAAARGPLPKGVAPEDSPMRKAPSLSISPEKIFFIVAKSRQSDGTATELDANSTSADDDAVHGFEDHSRMTDRSELSGFIRGLNVDEQVDLVALMWLGRGDGDLDNWRDLRSEASRAHNNRTARYLIETPMLADYLEEALSQFGKSFEDFEAPL